MKRDITLKDKLIVALDFDNLKQAKIIVDKLYPVVKIFKIGSQLFTSCGPKVVDMAHKKGAKVFLDLKFHDIPNTVAGAVKSAKSMGVFMFNMHAFGGYDMMSQAVKAKGKKGPILLGVTVLTSMDKTALKSIGINRSPMSEVEILAYLSKKAGLDGVVCSPKEISLVRKTCGKKFTIVTPGIRPLNSDSNDQKRICTPEYAINSGADYIVVGRPITLSKNPLLSAKSFYFRVACPTA